MVALLSNRLDYSPRYRLLEAATRMFAERGFNAVSMRQLGRAVGLQAGSLYAHIESKEELLQELIEEGFEQLVESTRDRLYYTSLPEKRVSVFVQHHLEFQRTHPDWHFLAQIEIRYLPRERTHEILRLQQAYCSLLEESLRSLSKGGQALMKPELVQQALCFLNGVSCLGNVSSYELNFTDWGDNLSQIIVKTCLSSSCGQAQFNPPLF